MLVTHTDGTMYKADSNHKRRHFLSNEEFSLTERDGNSSKIKNRFDVRHF